MLAHCSRCYARQILSLSLLGALVILFARNYYTSLRLIPSIEETIVNISSVIKTEGGREQYKFSWSTELNAWTLVEFNGEAGGRAESKKCLWPEDCKDDAINQDDRIINQLILGSQTERIFNVLPPDLSYSTERNPFDECPVNKCRLVSDRSQADALIFVNSLATAEDAKHRRPDQIWIAYLLESPIHTYDPKYPRKDRARFPFNWTASYRRDSDIVTPYSKFVVFKDKVSEYIKLKSSNFNDDDDEAINESYSESSELHKNLIRGKKLKVAWFVSNCHAANFRLEFAKELAKYVQVDIYGRCGNLTCARQNKHQCLDMINKEYKFYLSFENSNCHEYITEKLYENSYNHNDLNHLVVPIVMGPPKEDYDSLVPPASFIHVDDFKSPKDLAEYLKLLDTNDALYYSYFRWKQLGRFIDTKFMCRVCAMLHESWLSKKAKSYDNLISWLWRSKNGADACKRK